MAIPKTTYALWGSSGLLVGIILENFVYWTFFSAESNENFLKIWIPVILGLFVLVGTHRFAASRDEKSKRRETEIKYLQETFRMFLESSNERFLWEVNTQLQRGLADMQAIGTLDDVKLAQQFVDDLRFLGEADMNPILESLRNRLRLLLGQPPVAGPVTWYRAYSPEQARARGLIPQEFPRSIRRSKSRKP